MTAPSVDTVVDPLGTRIVPGGTPVLLASGHMPVALMPCVEQAVSEPPELDEEDELLLDEVDPLLEEDELLLDEDDPLLEEDELLLDEVDPLLEEDELLLDEVDPLLEEDELLLDEDDPLLEDDELLPDEDELLSTAIVFSPDGDPPPPQAATPNITITQTNSLISISRAHPAYRSKRK